MSTMNETKKTESVTPASLDPHATQQANPKKTHWSWARHTVQVLVLVLLVSPLLLSGWSLFGSFVGGDAEVATPADLPFFGSLSSSSIAGFELLDPFAVMQTIAAAKTFDVDWLLAIVPVIVVYGLIRGRAFCGWVCPANLVLEVVDALRRKLGIKVSEMPVPRHAKIWIALAVLVLSAVFSVPLFESFSPISAVSKVILFGSVAGLWTLLAIVLMELFWGHRVWCRSLCPLGGFYEVLGRVGQVNVRFDRNTCIHCNACKHACLSDPGILDPVLTERDVIVRAGDCMACGSCIDACPTQALSFGLGRPTPEAHPTVPATDPVPER